MESVGGGVEENSTLWGKKFWVDENLVGMNFYVITLFTDVQKKILWNLNSVTPPPFTKRGGLRFSKILKREGYGNFLFLRTILANLDNLFQNFRLRQANFLKIVTYLQKKATSDMISQYFIWILRTFSYHKVFITGYWKVAWCQMDAKARGQHFLKREGFLKKRRGTFKKGGVLTPLQTMLYVTISYIY